MRNFYGVGNTFFVSWNGTNVFGPTISPPNPPAASSEASWTNIQILVRATATNTVLQFEFQVNNDVLGLDNISVVSEQPGIAGVNFSGANLVINGSNGFSGVTYYVLTSTNLALPRNQWTPVATNVLSVTGNFNLTVTNAVNPAIPKQFYLLQIP